MEKSKGLTFFLSFVPGVGHYYLGQMNRGLQIMIMFFGSMFLLSFLRMDFATPYVAIIIWFYSLFDSLQQHRIIEEKQEVVDPTIFSWDKFNFNRLWVGWGLIILGIYLTLDRVSSYFFRWDYYEIQTLRTISMAIIFIAIGIYLLTGKKLSFSKKEKGDKK